MRPTALIECNLENQADALERSSKVVRSLARTLANAPDPLSDYVLTLAQEMRRYNLAIIPVGALNIVKHCLEDASSDEYSTQEIEAATKAVTLALAPATAPDQPPVTMVIPTERNSDLREFGRRWRLDGDWLICRGCQRAGRTSQNSALIASRDHDGARHADGCSNAESLHPWAELRLLLAAEPERAS